jgi:hypothetical protein
MKHFTAYRLAQASVAVLLLIAIRSLGQVLWSSNTAARPLGEEQIFYIRGAFIAALAALAALILHALNRNQLSASLTAMTVIALLVYKVRYLLE